MTLFHAVTKSLANFCLRTRQHPHGTRMAPGRALGSVRQSYSRATEFVHTDMCLSRLVGQQVFDSARTQGTYLSVFHGSPNFAGHLWLCALAHMMLT